MTVYRNGAMPQYAFIGIYLHRDRGIRWAVLQWVRHDFCPEVAKIQAACTREEAQS